MKPRLIITFLSTILSSRYALAKVDAVQTPPDVQSCKEATFQWTGGIPPFFLEFESSVNDTYSYHVVFINVTENLITTKLNFPSGWIVQGQISDNLNNTAPNEVSFNTFTMGDSGDHGCFVSAFTPDDAAPTPNATITGFTDTPNHVPQCQSQTVKWTGSSPSWTLNAVGSGSNYTTAVQFRGIVGQQATIIVPFAAGTPYILNFLPQDQSQVLSSNALTVGSSSDNSCLLVDPITTSTPSPTSPALSTSSVVPGGGSSSPHTSATSIAIGVVIGVICLVSLVSLLLYARRRRRRRVRVLNTDLLGGGRELPDGSVDPLGFNDIAIVEPLILHRDTNTTSSNRKKSEQPPIKLVNLNSSSSEVHSTSVIHSSEEAGSGPTRAVYHSDAGPLEEFPPAYGDFRRRS